MTNIGTLTAELGLDTTAFDRGAIIAKNRIGGFVNDASKKFAGLESVIGGVSVVMGAIAATGAVAYLKSAAAAAIESQTAWNDLGAAIETHGGLIDQAMPRIKGLASEYQRTFGIADETTARSIDRLVTYGMTIEEATQSFKTALDIAVGRRVDIESVVDAIAKSAAGSTMQLQRLVGKVEDAAEGAASHMELMAMAAGRFSGRAVAQLETIESRVKRLKEAVSELHEAFGARVLAISVGDAQGVEKFTKIIFDLAKVLAPPDGPADGIERLRAKLELLEAASDMPKFNALALATPMFTVNRTVLAGVAWLIDLVTDTTDSLKRQIATIEAYGEGVTETDLQIAQLTENIHRMKEEQSDFPDWSEFADNLKAANDQMDLLIEKRRRLQWAGEFKQAEGLAASLLEGIDTNAGPKFGPGKMTSLEDVLEHEIKAEEEAHEKMLKDRADFFDRWDAMIRDRDITAETDFLDSLEHQARLAAGFSPLAGIDEGPMSMIADQLMAERDALEELLSQDEMTRDSMVKNAEKYRRVMMEVIAADAERMRQAGVSAEVVADTFAMRTRLLEEEIADLSEKFGETGGWLEEWAEYTSANMADAFSDGFFKLLRGELESFADFWEATWDMMAAYAAQKAGAEMASALEKLAGWGINALSRSGGGGGAVGDFEVAPEIFAAEGAYVTRPTLAMIGESGPEAVIPMGKFNSTKFWDALRGGDGGTAGSNGNTTVIVNIKTEDVASFQRSKSQVLSDIGAVVSRAQRRNG
jgi:hypothetical protein